MARAVFGRAVAAGCWAAIAAAELVESDGGLATAALTMLVLLLVAIGLDQGVGNGRPDAREPAGS